MLQFWNTRHSPLIGIGQGIGILKTWRATPISGWKERCRVKIRILGSHGSDQLTERNGVTSSCRPCAFLINDQVLLDAGTVGSRLTLAEQQQISQVLLSHSHFDHIKDLPTLADNLVGESARPLVVAGIPDALETLHTHVFNSTVYPDFFSIHNADPPLLTSQSLRPRQEWTAAGLRILPIMVNHQVPTVGYLISDKHATILYSGDTYQTEDLWEAAAAAPNLAAAFIECSYPNNEVALARQAKHLTPQLLSEEFRKIRRRDLPLYAYHLKPRFQPQIEQELQALRLPHLSVLQEDQELHF